MLVYQMAIETIHFWPMTMEPGKPAADVPFHVAAYAALERSRTERQQGRYATSG